MSSTGASTSSGNSMLLTPEDRSARAGAAMSPPASSEMLPPTRSAIERFASRRARLQFCRGVAIGIVCFLAGMFLLMTIDYFWSLSIPLRTMGALLVDITALAIAWRCGIRESRQRDWAAIARSMEAATPPLRERLLSAVELEDPRHANGSVAFRSSLQSGVAGQLSSLDIREMLPWRLVRTSLAVAAGLIAAIALLSLIPSLQLPRRFARAFVPMAPIQRASITQLEITAPRPASKSVAEGDLIAVAAEVRKRGRGEVQLQWQSDDGRSGRLPMSPRANWSTEHAPPPETETEREESAAAEFYAVNLQVDQSVVHYRVLAGDAETRWHRLTPMPRPRVVSYTKRYRFPTYAKLPDAESTEEYGDLEALIGTSAEVIVEFDQPVRNAQVYFGEHGQDTGIAMQSVQDDPTRFRFEVAIQTPGSFRVDAVSLHSELSNPFLPRCAIDPVADRSPTALWSASIPKRQIASSAAVLVLPGRIDDDLPMDRYVVESIIDSGPIREQVIALDPASTEQETQWDLDLMKIGGNGGDGQALPTGTLVRARLVALDRAGKRGESDWRFIYVADEQFDPNRHTSLYVWQGIATKLTSWFTDLQEFSRRMKSAVDEAKEVEDAGSEAYAPAPEWMEELAGLEQRWHDIAGEMDPAVLQAFARQLGPDDMPVEPRTLAELIVRSTDSVAVDQLSLMDRLATNVLGDLQNAVAAWRLAADIGDPLIEYDQKHVVSEVAAAIRKAESPGSRVRELPSRLLAVDLAEALAVDWHAIGRQAEMLADPDSAVPIERLPGQADLLAERLRQVEAMIARVEKDLPEETIRHLRNFRSFLAESTFRIEQAVEKLQLDRNPNVEQDFRESIGKLSHDIRQHHVGSFAHGSTFSQIAAAVRDLGRDDQQAREAVKQLGRDGREWQVSQSRIDRAQNQPDSDEILPIAAQEKLRRFVFTTQLDELIARYDRAESRERIRADMQVATATDLRLVRRVAEQVTKDGLATASKESLGDLFSLIEDAAMTLESGNQIMRLTGQLQNIADRERYGDDRADHAVVQGVRLEHYQVFSELPLKQLGDAGIDRSLIQDLQDTRRGTEFSQAREWMTRRRYDPPPFVSAAAPVQSLVSRLREAIPVIEDAMVDARQTLRDLLPTTSELASEAAEAAERQQGGSQEDAAASDTQSAESEGEENASPPSLEDLQAKVDRLAEDLVERADQANLAETAERDLAHDADAALQKIQQQMEAVAAPQGQPETQPARAQKNESLQQLAETLNTTAAHFAAADAGEDVSQTRQELRENLPSDALQDSREQASSSSELAQASPEELLRRLEQKLQRDPPMQADLSEISRRTVADVEQAVRAAAEQEERLQRDLEKAGPALLEQKKRLRDQLRSLTDQSRSVAKFWLDAAERASAQSDHQSAREAISDLRRELGESADQADRVQNDDALLKEIQAASEQLRDSLQHVAEESRELSEEAETMRSQESHPNERARRGRAKQLEASQRRAQNEWIKSLDRQTPRWRQRRDEADRRVHQAEQQEREAEEQLQQAEQRVKQKPDQEWLQDKVDETRQRVAEAANAAEAAKETREAADRAEQQAASFTDATKKQSVEEITAKNPNAELLARASEISRRELQRLAAEAKQLVERSQAAERPQPRQSSAQWLAKTQADTGRAASQAAEDLQRAARHEQRLGNAEGAEQLAAAAESLQETVDSVVEQAQLELDRAAQAESPESRREPAGEAHQNLGVAADQLKDHAAGLSGLSSSIPAVNADPDGAPERSPTGGVSEKTGTAADANRSEKLARVLDELDRAVFGSTASEASASDGSAPDGGASEEQGSGESGSAEQSSGGSGGESSSGGSGKPSSSPAAASPTLAEAAQQAARRLAAERQQRLRQIAASGKPGAQDGDQPSGDQPGRPGSQSGDSFVMPSGGLLSIDGEPRSDGQWGALRERASEDMIQDRKTSVPLSYRGAIDAYFQTIAGEAARAGGRAPESRSNPAEGGP
ncbi:hypothetical protein [Allorhodopirellula solitaria]|uniref:Uncharacterized protein n=1 Tax=Allorhodopirellula solitaria TaxID=2527987 RepID=A0A5C5XVE7_9BACT|nr:hypothetical protein [Allorhodopirellula solitaria]TWT67296.1 hypothetical protein CA85_21460 [Allorhodopirellula solitaria]